MAHTDACKIQVTEFVRKLTTEGMAIRAACAEVERQSDGIPAETIRRWWKEIKEQTNNEWVNNDPPFPTSPNLSETQDNQVPEVKHGGKREGAGAPQKYEKVPEPPKKFSNAMQTATFVISHLQGILPDDPQRETALEKVSEWIDQNL